MLYLQQDGYFIDRPGLSSGGPKTAYSGLEYGNGTAARKIVQRPGILHGKFTELQSYQLAAELQFESAMSNFSFYAIIGPSPDNQRVPARLEEVTGNRDFGHSVTLIVQNRKTGPDLARIRKDPHSIACEFAAALVFHTQPKTGAARDLDPLGVSSVREPL